MSSINVFAAGSLVSLQATNKTIADQVVKRRIATVGSEVKAEQNCMISQMKVFVKIQANLMPYVGNLCIDKCLP